MARRHQKDPDLSIDQSINHPTAPKQNKHQINPVQKTSPRFTNSVAIIIIIIISRRNQFQELGKKILVDLICVNLFNCIIERDSLEGTFIYLKIVKITSLLAKRRDFAPHI
jgi:hypothetical protein